MGISMDCGYLANERAFISLASLEEAAAEPGTEVEVVWGEDPNAAKPQVEPHRQVVLRAIVAEAPFVQFGRGANRAASVHELLA